MSNTKPLPELPWVAEARRHIGLAEVPGKKHNPRPLQNPHLRRISALCAAHSLAYLYDMSSLAALLSLELHPHLEVLQRSQPSHHQYAGRLEGMVVRR